MKTAVEYSGIKAECITPDDKGHYFFGYYDLQPFDTTGRYHLCHRAPFEQKIPTENDICELGVIDLEKKEFVKYAETTAWNFQQGALLRWYKDDEHILFNVKKDGAYKCCILNIKTGEEKILPMAIADVSSDGKYGLCINFSRIFDFRAGYGYAGIKDPNFNVNAPEDDGVFLMDMETGDCKLILNYKQMKDAYPTEPFCNGKLLVNHINFNPSGTRFAMLFRNFPEPGNPWKTQLLTGDLEGNLFCLCDFGFHSHYHWKNDSELLIFSGLDEETRKKNIRDGLYLFKDLTKEFELLPEPNPTRDVHCLYSPNRRYIIGDDYPDTENFRAIHLIDTEKNTDIIIGKYLSVPQSFVTDARCDLHGRFDRRGRYISFDSIHTGKRTVCMIDLMGFKDYEF